MSAVWRVLLALTVPHIDGRRDLSCYKACDGDCTVKLSQEELTLYAIRQAQLISADYIHPGPRDSEKDNQRPALYWSAIMASPPTASRLRPECGWLR